MSVPSLGTEFSPKYALVPLPLLTLLTIYIMRVLEDTDELPEPFLVSSMEVSFPFKLFLSFLFM